VGDRPAARAGTVDGAAETAWSVFASFTGLAVVTPAFVCRRSGRGRAHRAGVGALLVACAWWLGE
jgi:hypothetical protein